MEKEYDNFNGSFVVIMIIRGLLGAMKNYKTIPLYRTGNIFGWKIVAAWAGLIIEIELI